MTIEEILSLPGNDLGVNIKEAGWQDGAYLFVLPMGDGDYYTEAHYPVSTADLSWPYSSISNSVPGSKWQVAQ